MENEKYKDLLNIIVKKNIDLNVKILQIYKDLPDNQIENFKEWVLHKGVELGIGKHYEFYGYTENYLDDIPVLFYVFIN